MNKRASKASLRAACRERRRLLPAAERQRAEQAIAVAVGSLSELSVPKADGGVLAYAAMGSEVSTQKIMNELWATRHRVALPRVMDAGQGQMQAVWIEQGAVLESGPHGTWAPPLGVVLNPDVDPPTVVLVPGVAFCPQTGMRLGQGGGFYDRYLARVPKALVVGLAFATQCDEAVAGLAQPHDRGVDVLVTEAGVRRFSPASSASAPSSFEH
ncbi:MAG: 5-formyltetrahydrofolate cyclo-ligase [Algisphaera sp.]